MVSPAHISRGDGEEAKYGAELSSPKAVAVNELCSPKAVAVNDWAKGSPKLPQDYQRVVPAFLNPDAETPAEITAFDLSRFFIEIHKSTTKNVDDIITQGFLYGCKEIR